MYDLYCYSDNITDIKSWEMQTIDTLITQLLNVDLHMAYSVPPECEDSVRYEYII